MSATLVRLPSGQTYHTAVVDWLLKKKEAFPKALVIVPTAQSGRRVRLSLAERGPVLAPKVVTTSFLLETPEAAPDAIETLAWVEALEGVRDWDQYMAIFPESPAGDGPGWALGLAKSLLELRKDLQENALTLQSASRLIDPIEQDRWQQLAMLEKQAEEILGNWELKSKSGLLAQGELSLSEEIEEVIVAGVLDLPPVVTDFLERQKITVSVLLPPGDEDVDPWGRPKLDWNEREIPWPQDGSVSLTGDPRQQADLAVSKISEAETPSQEVGIATADPEVATELVRSFARADWRVHDPGASLPSSIAGWLSSWRRFLQNDGVKEVVDLLAFSQTRYLVQEGRARLVESLSQLRDSHLVRNVDDIVRVRKLIETSLENAETERKRNRLEYQLASAMSAESAMKNLGKLRVRFLREGFHVAMKPLLSKVDPGRSSGIDSWLEITSGVGESVGRSPVFWIDLLLQELGPTPEEPPNERVLDVQGWLELLHEPARHLIILGMNEGRIPSLVVSNPWLPESSREALGLPGERSRAARDAYLLHTLLGMRRDDGRVDIVVGKTSFNGDVLQPSRLLLTAKGKTLAQHVKMLFADVEPIDSSVSWHLEDHWRWRPRIEKPKPRISVTAFSKYLACPFRYYLQRVVGMNEPEPERVEWNHRDFGNILHEVLEAWGRDVKIRDSSDATELNSWLVGALDKLTQRHFGGELPLAVSLQVESMKLRLRWFAEEQARIRDDGWKIVEVEKNFEFELGRTMVTGQIDRVEKHEDGRVRVLDYKTSKEAKDVVREHQKQFRSEPPVHLTGDEVITPGGKTWTNLQIPLYAVALERVDEVGYFALGQDRRNVKTMLWEDFEVQDQESALKCAEWVVDQIEKEVFWPPAKKVKYEEFQSLSFGRELAEAFVWEGGSE